MADDIKTNEEKNYPDILALASSQKGSDYALKTAEALAEAAKKAHVSLKTEIHDNGRIIDQLEAEEIKACRGIIVATDTSVVMKRFAGKQVLVTTTSKAINEPVKLIKNILNNEAPLTETFRPYDRDKANSAEALKEDAPSEIMDILGRIFPFLVGGAFMLTITMLLKDRSSALFLFFETVGESIFEMFDLVLAAYIAYVIADRNALMVGFTGGIIAKAGYSLAWLSDQSTPLCPSGLIGAMIAGILAGYITRFLQKLCSRMPSSCTLIIVNLIYPIIGVLVISILMFIFNGLLSDISLNLESCIRTLGLSSHLLALIILLAVVLASLLFHRSGKDRKN